MIWVNPAALLGMVLIGVPIVVHLLTRRNAKVERFPTLRFLRETPPVHTRTALPRDVLLLLVRCAVIATAVAALAQPLFLTADREAQLTSELARAIIVDTSSSMRRLTANGVAAADVARDRSISLAGEASASVLLQVSEISAALDGASSWLSQQHGKRELLIVSDFQNGELLPGDLASVDSSIAIRLLQMVVADTNTRIATASLSESGISSASIEVSNASGGGSKLVEWRNISRAPDTATSILVLAAPEHEAEARAAARAAAHFGSPLKRDSARAIAFVHASHESSEQLLRSSAPPAAKWMGEIVSALRHDPLVIATALEARAATTINASAGSYPVVARGSDGTALVLAMTSTIGGKEYLTFFTLADARSLLSAAVMNRILRSTSLDPPADELDPRVVDAAELQSWERTATGGAVLNRDSELSDARWFWIAALTLIGVEWMLRSGKRGANMKNAV